MLTLKLIVPDLPVSSDTPREQPGNRLEEERGTLSRCEDGHARSARRHSCNDKTGVDGPCALTRNSRQNLKRAVRPWSLRVSFRPDELRLVTPGDALRSPSNLCYIGLSRDEDGIQACLRQQSLTLFHTPAPTDSYYMPGPTMPLLASHEL